MKTLIVLISSLISLSSFALQRPDDRRVLREGFQVFEKTITDKKGKPKKIKTVRVALFDADSTLRVSKSGGVSANHETDAVILPCVSHRIAQLVEKGYLIAVVSNQGGIGSTRIKLTHRIANAALQYTMDQLVKENSKAEFHYYDYAAYKNGFRKPGVGMISLLEDRLGDLGMKNPDFRNVIIDKEHSFMVGDSLFKMKLKELKPNCEKAQQFSNSDRGVAENYGVRFFDPADFFGWLNFDEPIQVFKSKKWQWDGLPKKAKGKNSYRYCENLESYNKYSEWIKAETLTSKWVADYQCNVAGKCAALGETLKCKK